MSVAERLTRRGALAAMFVAACGPGSQPSGSRENPLSQTTPKALPTPRPGFTSESAVNISALAPGETTRSPHEPLFQLISQDGALVRDAKGITSILDIDGKPVWQSKDAATPLAIGSERGLIMANDGTVRLLNAKSGAEIAALPSPYPIPKEQLSKQYNRGAVIKGDFIILPHSQTVTGTYDGVTVFTKDGKRLWETPKSGQTNSGRLNHTFLEATSSKIVANSAGLINFYSFDNPTPIRIGSGSGIEANRPWIYHVFENYVATSVSLLPLDHDKRPGLPDSETLQVALHDIQTGKELAKWKLVPGQFDHPGRTNCNGMCHAKPLRIRVSPHASPLNPTKPDIAIFVEANLGTDEKPLYGSGLLLFSQLLMKPVPTPETFTVSPAPTFNGSSDFDFSFYSSSPQAITYYPGGKIEHERAPQVDRLLRVYKYTQNRPGEVKTESFLYPTDAMRFITGGKGNTYVLANWDENTKPKGPLTLYGIYPSTQAFTENGVRWKQELKSKDAFIFVKGDKIYVFADSFLKLDLELGKPELKASFTSPIIYAKDIGDNRIAVLTADNKLQIFRLS